MSQENAEIVRKVYTAVSKGEAATVLDSYDPEVEFDFSHSPFAPLLRQEVYRGHEGIRTLMRERHDQAWETIADELSEVIEVGEHVITVVTSAGRGRVSGVEIDRTHAGVWTIRDGKVRRVVWFGTRDEALKAAGLNE